MDAIISFFSYKNGGAGLGILVLYWILWEFFYEKYKRKYDNKWIKASIPAFLSYIGSSIICFLISQDTRVFIYPIILPITTVLMEVYSLNQKPNIWFPSSKDKENQRRTSMRCFDVVFVLVITFLLHLLFRVYTHFLILN